jgi:uroporphyrinogen III methyltransferase/synthase
LSADAIVYDSLANPDLLRIPRPEGARAPVLHDVGKRGGDDGSRDRQDQINELLVDLVRQGKKVVRLKGGDPFVFGRGGEEAQALNDAGLPFEVVPGVTAGIAAPAYAGIPVTHRGMATSVTFVTGHEDPTKGAPQVDWSALAKSGGTIVLYMGMKKLSAVAEALIKGGMQADIPAAAIQWGTLNEQRTVVATLATIAERAAAEGIGAPAITVIGWTVVLRDETAWFDRKPLFGQSIVVTRAGEVTAPGSLGNRLRGFGAQVIEIAATKIVPLDPRELIGRFVGLGDYSWIVFTSANAVAFFWRALLQSGRDSRVLGGVKVCSVGPATSEALSARGIVPDVQAERFAAEGLLEGLADRDDVRGTRVLYPCAEGARATLQVGLGELGAAVDRVHIYRSEADPGGAGRIEAALRAAGGVLVAFTSASAVRSFAGVVPAELLPAVRAASIGPVTTEALRDAGINVVVEAGEATLDGLVRAILNFSDGDNT